MKVKFNGFRQDNRKGCGVCGTKRKVQGQLKLDKRIMLPSGQFKLFTYGQTYDLSDMDAEYVLKQETYYYNGTMMHSFVKV